MRVPRRAFFVGLMLNTLTAHFLSGAALFFAIQAFFFGGFRWLGRAALADTVQQHCAAMNLSFLHGVRKPSFPMYCLCVGVRYLFGLESLQSLV